MSRHIRQVDHGDIHHVALLMTELAGKQMSLDTAKRRIEFVERSPFDSLYLCEEGDRVLGLLGFRIRENLEDDTRYGEVSVLVVHPEARNLGIGKYLIECAERLAKEHECIGTWLVSGYGREEAAHAFYKKVGFEVNGVRFRRLLD